MAVEEHPLYVTWMTALTRFEQTRKFYEIIKEKRGADDPLTRNAFKKMDEAGAEYDAVVNRL